MKTKKQIYLFPMILFFLSVFFLRIDGANNVAKACSYCDSACTAGDGSSICTTEEYDQCNTDNCGDTTSADSFVGPPNLNVVTQAECDSYGYDGGKYVVSSDLTTCVPAGSNMTDAQCKDAYGPSSYLAADDTCAQFDPNTEQCTTDADCTSTKGSGYKCDTSNGDCVPSGLASLTGDECRTDDDCINNFQAQPGYTYVCSGLVTKTCELTPSAQTPAEITAAKTTANTTASSANAATTIQNAAAQRVNTETAQQADICKNYTKEACDVATASLNDAKAAYDKATEDAKNAIATANAAAAVVNPGTATGAGFMLCANGVLGTVCDGGGGTPYVAGMSTSSYGAGTTGLGSYGGSSGGVQAPKCGANFQDIGGVCFPMTTGLSDAPVYVILSNIFSWLMGLFTTIAVLAFVVSGIQYFMSSGDESMAEKAKDNAKNSLIGIVVGLSGFIIIKAIAAALSGQTMFF